MKELAAVTGATGMVGKRIVSLLLKQGFSVRILTRNKSFVDTRVEIIHGDLDDTLAVIKLLNGASCLFHCAAELNDENKMWQTNVIGTQVLIENALKFQLKYICHLSSVGVIGKVSGQFVDESTPCFPINMYEKSKLEAEALMRNFKGNARVVILRPTNVIDKTKNSILTSNRLKKFLKGGENAHIVHAEDVASSALYFLANPSPISPDCFIISCDEEKLNTLAGCVKVCTNKSIIHLPWQIPYLLRRIAKGPCNRGDICYSSKKLLSAGFIFPLGFKAGLKDICETF